MPASHRQPSIVARIQYALRHICWPYWCERHRLAYATEFCPECNGARVERAERAERERAFDLEGLDGALAVEVGIDKLLAFRPEDVGRYLRARRRNGLHRAQETGELSGR